MLASSYKEPEPPNKERRLFTHWTIGGFCGRDTSMQRIKYIKLFSKNGKFGYACARFSTVVFPFRKPDVCICLHLRAFVCVHLHLLLDSFQTLSRLFVNFFRDFLGVPGRRLLFSLFWGFMRHSCKWLWRTGSQFAFVNTPFLYTPFATLF